MKKKLYFDTMSWEQVRAKILLWREDLEGRVIDSDAFDAIVARRTEKLSERLRREISVFLRGYAFDKVFAEAKR